MEEQFNSGTCVYYLFSVLFQGHWTVDNVKIFIVNPFADCQYRTICLVKLERRPSSGTGCYPEIIFRKKNFS